MDQGSLFDEAGHEAQRYRWIESEKAGCDLGDEARERWVRLHWLGFLRARWAEHLQGKRFWIELDRNDFGLLQRQFADHALLVDRILDRLEAGQQNLDIVLWATEWGIPMAPLLEILTALDLNSRRLVHQFREPVVPVVTIDPDWLTWQEGTIPRLARHIDEDKAFDLLPVLGDALEEAGCADPLLLDHCRTGRHTNWCWLVSLLLKAQ
jgi:hypothetical protein